MSLSFAANTISYLAISISVGVCLGLFLEKWTFAKAKTPGLSTQLGFTQNCDFQAQYAGWIPSQSWSSGVYLMTITGGGKTQVERLVKE